MTIYVVQSGDTLESIGRYFGISANYLARTNDLNLAQPLVPGQTIVVNLPAVIHTVAGGDTLYSIAARYGTTVTALYQNNPFLMGQPRIVPGDTIVISFASPKIGTLAVNGYTYPFIDRDVLRRTLPYLTSMTVFSYGFTREGNLIEPDDTEIVEIARSYGVAPILLISTLSEEGTFSIELSSILLNDPAMQDKLIDQLLEVMEQKNYYALDIDFEYVYRNEKDLYTAFIQKTTTRMNQNGYEVIVALAPKTSADQPGLLYEAHDYAAIGAAANRVLLMTYEWGYTYGPPMAVAPINMVTRVVDYALTVIPSEKIYMGMPNYGYNWALPFVQGESKAQSLSNVDAVALAAETSSVIQFDETAQTPYFTYTANDSVEHVVWFEDARSVQAKLNLAHDRSLYGVSWWNIMKYFPQSWLVLNGEYNILKVL